MKSFLGKNIFKYEKLIHFRVKGTEVPPDPNKMAPRQKQFLFLFSGEKEARMLRDEVALLHSQLLFERHRRETLGMRNRRLLGKTRSSRILEEQNTALVRHES